MNFVFVREISKFRDTALVGNVFSLSFNEVVVRGRLCFCAGLKPFHLLKPAVFIQVMKVSSAMIT